MDKQTFLSRYLVDRRGTDSYKWDGMLEEKSGSRDLTSMWIADMEFKTPEAVVDALVSRARNGIFGLQRAGEVLSGVLRLDGAPVRLPAEKGVAPLHHRLRHRHCLDGPGVHQARRTLPDPHAGLLSLPQRCHLQ